jgi:drug/metabolite transporter (DMT)-like permease
LLGTILAVCAGWIILHSFKRPDSAKGISFVLIMSVANATIIVLFKYLLSSYNAASLTFFADFLPATIFTLILMPGAAARIKNLFKDDWRVVFLACALGALSNLALNAALSLHDAASVLVVNEAFLVLLLVGEHVYLKERERAWVKLTSVILATAGAILIDISH